MEVYMLLCLSLLSLQARTGSGLNETLNYRGYTYTVFDTTVYQSQAVDICGRLGGSLVTIKSVDVQNAIRVIVNNLMVSAGRYGQWTTFWIGLSKNETHHWLWEKNRYGHEKLGFTYWMTSVNATLLEKYYNCAVFIHYHGEENSRWSAAPCFGYRTGFICQKVSYATSVTIGDYQYGIFDVDVTKATATTLCATKNAELAVIHTRLLWHSIVARIEAYLLKKDRLKEPAPYWLDLSKSKNNSWTWRGEGKVPSSIQDLMLLNTNNSAENRCGVLLYQNVQGFWTGVQCGFKTAGVICRKNINVCSALKCTNIHCSSKPRVEQCKCGYGKAATKQTINRICNLESLKSKFNVLDLQKVKLIANMVTENTTIILTCTKHDEIYTGTNRLTCVDGTWSPRELGYCEKPVRCHDLSLINNGDITLIGNPRTIFHAGSRARITCDRGYLRQGKEEIECTDSGVWSAPVPYCSALTCSRDLSKVDYGRRCNKPCKDQTDCNQPGEKCLCDDWCGKSCFDPNSTCEDLMQPHHGYILGTQRNYMATVMYSCHGGFLLSGTSHRRCRSDGKWTDIAPKCLPQSSCGQAGFLGNSILPEPVAKVVRGQAAPHGAWPWQVMLIHNNRDKVRESVEALLGGATIINENWILTSAHLFDGFISNEPTNWLHRFLIVIGITEIPGADEPLPDVMQVFRPKDVVRHEKYDKVIFDYDISLIRIGAKVIAENNVFRTDGSSDTTTLTFSKHVRPVCLPCINDQRYPLKPNTREYENVKFVKFDERKCEKLHQNNNEKSATIVTGFGDKTPREVSDFELGRSRVIRQGFLQILPPNNCTQGVKRIRLKWNKARFTNRMLCAASADPTNIQDACIGDSGGPLLQRALSSSGHYYWIQVGIISWGWGCANTDPDGYTYPGYYTDVTSVVQWISLSMQKYMKDEIANQDMAKTKPNLEAQSKVIVYIYEAKRELVHKFTLSRYTTIIFIKQEIENMFGYSKKRQQLLYNDKELKGIRTLHSYRFRSGKVIYLTLRKNDDGTC